MTGVAIIGCAGRMGQMLVREVQAAEGMHVSAASESAGATALGQDAGLVAGIEALGVPVASDVDALLSQADVAIDFTVPENTAAVAPLAARHGTPLVVGTTGLDARQQETLNRASNEIAVVWAPNMSVGVNVLLRLVAEAAQLLGSDYALEIVEAHHRHKKDAPSGTALRLAEVLASATANQGTLEQRACYGRRGVGLRPPAEIGIHTVRGGDIVGDHTVMYCGDGERLELTHRASSRQTFACGAVRAARWVLDRPAGLYDMHDVLGLRRQPQSSPQS